MFPFTYQGEILYPKENTSESDIKKIIDHLKEEFYDCTVTSDTISFSGFKILIKRFRWLSEGKISISKSSDSTISLKLNLTFNLGIMLILFIIAILAIQRLGVLIESFEIGVVTLFFLLLYYITVSIYRASIRSTINRAFDPTEQFEEEEFN